MPVGFGALALLVFVLVVALLRVHSRTKRELGAAHAEAAALRAQVEEIERRLAAATPVGGSRRDDADYVITGLGETEQAAGSTPATVDRALFADLVLRETVVKAAGLVHGVRRALAPENRNRIRFEMKREVKRARRQRRADIKEARREWAARQRADMTDGEDAA